MNKIILVTLSLFIAISAFGQSKFDMSGQMIVNAEKQQRAAVSRAEAQSSPAPLPAFIQSRSDNEQRYSALVTVKGGKASDVLADMDIVSARGNMAIVCLTAAQMEELSQREYVTNISMGSDVTPQLNVARKNTGVNKVQAGDDALKGVPYDGSGVIAGLMDTGLDVNHINFLDAEGNPRTTRLWTLFGANTVTTYQTPKEISEFTTEAKDATHGTHVLGIIGGSYNGPATYATINTFRGLEIIKQTATKSAIPYYGVATGAELAVACGSFGMNHIENAVGLIADYAAEKNMPCVINLSLGSTTGPHDGTDASSRWFESVGEDAILCISAGNDGNSPMSLVHTFEKEGEEVKSIILSSADKSGIIDIWGIDDSVFAVTFMMIDVTTGEELFSYDLDQNLEGGGFYIAGDNYKGSIYVNDEAFNKYFGEGAYVYLSSNINPDNNRYEVYSYLHLAGSGSQVLPALKFRSTQAGQGFYAYTNGDPKFMSKGLDGFTDGNADGSINSIACGNNVITVGSYTNLASWPTLSKEQYTYQNRPKAGAISSFSAYGKLVDGRSLPVIVGPGGSLISSYSKYYVDTKGTQDSGLTGKYVGEERNSYWAEAQGTSMSAPFVSGVIALWLQACPQLQFADVMEVMEHSSTHDEFTAQQPNRWGFGKINALEGLKYILREKVIAGIGDVERDDLFITPLGVSDYEVCLPGAPQISVDVYDTLGSLILSRQADSDSMTISLDALNSGMYIFKVTANNMHSTKKIIK